MCGEGALTFQTFEKVIELSVCHRQSTDVEFSNIRRLNILSKLEQDKFSKAIDNFSTNDAVNKKNEECLRKLNKPVLNRRKRLWADWIWTSIYS